MLLIVMAVARIADMRGYAVVVGVLLKFLLIYCGRSTPHQRGRSMIIMIEPAADQHITIYDDVGIDDDSNRL